MAFESIWGLRNATTISVKLATAEEVAPAMDRAEEAMRMSRGLRPFEENNFSLDTADALVSFWQQLTKVLFAVIPAVVGIGIVVGGIVIMNIMLVSVTERTREIGVRKALGAKRSDILSQFLVEATTLSVLGAAIGIGLGIGLAELIAALTPLPAAVAPWSIAAALITGAGVGIAAGMYPASRASMLDPITALRQE